MSPMCDNRPCVTTLELLPEIQSAITDEPIRKMDTIAEIEPLKAARALAFELIFREIKIFSRRADLPEKRIALAELEREILTIEKRWTAAGMIDEQPELEEEPAA